MNITAYETYHKAISSDEIALIVLQCSLICEQCLGEILFEEDKNTGFLTLGQKIDRVRRDDYSHLHTVLPLDGLKALCKLRNKVAHRLFYEITEEDIATVGFEHEEWAKKHCVVISEIGGYQDLHLFHKAHWGNDYLVPLTRTVCGLICYRIQTLSDAIAAEQGRTIQPLGAPCLP